jgi:pimeloyl-ACP methyl ester carboxylesterase
MKRFFAILPLLVSVTLLVGCSTIRRGVIQGTGHGDPAATVSPSPGYDLVRLKTPDSTEIVAQFGCATNLEGDALSDYNHCPTVIFFYPGGYDLLRCKAIFDGFRKLGVNILIPEYPGFGMSLGQASESGCYAAADAACDYIRGRIDLDQNQVFVIGWSVGGGVAIDLASRRHVTGVAAIATSTKIEDVVVSLTDKHWSTAWIPRIVVRGFVSQAKFDSLAKIPKVTAPILLVYSKRDELISDEMVSRLKRSANTEVSVRQIDGVSHRDYFKVEASQLVGHSSSLAEGRYKCTVETGEHDTTANA